MYRGGWTCERSWQEGTEGACQVSRVGRHGVGHSHFAGIGMLMLFCSIPFLHRHVDSDQAEVRSAALDAVESCYVGLDKDSARIHRLLGAVNDKTKTLIDEVCPSLVCVVLETLVCKVVSRKVYL